MNVEMTIYHLTPESGISIGVITPLGDRSDPCPEIELSDSRLAFHRTPVRSIQLVRPPAFHVT